MAVSWSKVRANGHRARGRRVTRIKTVLQRRARREMAEVLRRWESLRDTPADTAERDTLE